MRVAHELVEMKDEYRNTFLFGRTVIGIKAYNSVWNQTIGDQEASRSLREARGAIVWRIELEECD